MGSRQYALGSLRVGIIWVNWAGVEVGLGGGGWNKKDDYDFKDLLSFSSLLHRRQTKYYSPPDQGPLGMTRKSNLFRKN